MILDMTINLENMEKAKAEVLKLLDNPWADDLSIIISLHTRLDKINAKIEELKQNK